MKKRSTGFYVIELMIMVSIMGILAAIAIPRLQSLIGKSHANKPDNPQREPVVAKVKNEKSSPTDYDVTRLFVADGCAVYRFNDKWKWRYFTNCPGSVSWREGCGKNCTRRMDVETSERP